MAYPMVMKNAEFERIIENTPFGFGTARVVYRVTDDSNVVVKKSIKPFPGSNLTEWFIWSSANAEHDLLRSVLGECISISTSGTYLMMECLDDLTPDDYADVPDVPEWFNDPKHTAFGKRNGVIKIRDYGLVTGEKLLNRALRLPPAFALNARTARKFRLS